MNTPKIVIDDLKLHDWFVLPNCSVWELRTLYPDTEVGALCLRKGFGPFARRQHYRIGKDLEVLYLPGTLGKLREGDMFEILRHPENGNHAVGVVFEFLHPINDNWIRARCVSDSQDTGTFHRGDLYAFPKSWSFYLLTEGEVLFLDPLQPLTTKEMFKSSRVNFPRLEPGDWVSFTFPGFTTHQSETLWEFTGTLDNMALCRCLRTGTLCWDVGAVYRLELGQGSAKLYLHENPMGAPVP